MDKWIQFISLLFFFFSRINGTRLCRRSFNNGTSCPCLRRTNVGVLCHSWQDLSVMAQIHAGYQLTLLTILATCKYIAQARVQSHLYISSRCGIMVEHCQNKVRTVLTFVIVAIALIQHTCMSSQSNTTWDVKNCLGPFCHVS